jgi:hypothetical protein
MNHFKIAQQLKEDIAAKIFGTQKARSSSEERA